MGEASQPKYILGHEQSEIDRLMVQSAVMRPFTERLFKAAGMRTGMRVLDLGCGPWRRFDACRRFGRTVGFRYRD
jgi:hypothetical protein